MGSTEDASPRAARSGNNHLRDTFSFGAIPAAALQDSLVVAFPDRQPAGGLGHVRVLAVHRHVASKAVRRASPAYVSADTRESLPVWKSPATRFSVSVEPNHFMC